MKTLIPPALLVLSLSSLVAAEQAPRAAEQEPQPSQFIISDRPSTQSAAGVEIAFVTDASDPEFVGVRLNPHIEHLINPSVGVLASVSVATVFDDSESEVGLGNLEVGGFAVKPLSPSTDLVFRGSVFVPTASDSFEGRVTNLVNALTRLNDVASAVPDLFLIRGGASLIHRGDNYVLRVDGAFDFPTIAIDDNEIDDRTPVVHVGAGVAIGSGPGKFVAELTNLFSADADPGDGDDFVHQGAVGLSYDAGDGGAFQLAVSTLLDSLIEEDDGAILGVHLGYKRAY